MAAGALALSVATARDSLERSGVALRVEVCHIPVAWFAGPGLGAGVKRVSEPRA